MKEIVEAGKWTKVAAVKDVNNGSRKERRALLLHEVIHAFSAIQGSCGDCGGKNGIAQHKPSSTYMNTVRIEPHRQKCNTYGKEEKARPRQHRLPRRSIRDAYVEMN